MGSSWGDAARDLDPRRLAASAIPAGSQWKRAKESYWVRGRGRGRAGACAVCVGPSSSFGQASLPVFPTPAPHRVSAPSVRDRVPFSLSVLPREIIMKRRSDESSTRRTPLRAHLLFLDYSSAAGAAGPGNLRPRQWEMGRPGCNMPADSVELSATDSLAFPSFV
jgi:hypothetical protein